MSAPWGPPPEGEPPKETDPLLKQPPAVAKGGGGWKNHLTNFAVGVVASMVGVSALKAIWGSRSSSSSSAPAPIPTTSTVPNDPSNTPYPLYTQSGLPPSQSGQNQGQRRAVEHDKVADVFGESLEPFHLGVTV